MENFTTSFVAIAFSVLVIGLSFAFLAGIIAFCIWCSKEASVTKKKRNFVWEHSNALIRLRAINARYNFYPVPVFCFQHAYDNASFYETISAKDFLTYQLMYQRRKVEEGMQCAFRNSVLYPRYISEIKAAAVSTGFDTAPPFEKPDDLEALEKRMISDFYKKPTASFCIKRPTTLFSITVCLELTNMRGWPQSSKSYVFSELEIQEILSRLSNKQGGFYRDDYIWQAICRVERGRVSNKMRFAIYERDGYRCRKCGSTGKDLEIDHIFPISKGGKSEFDNLQTLCHRCNVQKGATVEPRAVNPRARWQGVEKNCSLCGAPLVLKKGKYGSFYGCSNYPNCKFKEKI